MKIKIRTNYKGFEIEATGEDPSDVLEELVRWMKAIDSHPLSQIITMEQEKTSVPESGSEVEYEHIKLEEDGPKLFSTFEIQGSRREKQYKAFLVLSYILKTKYDEKSPSSSKVSSLMKRSGIDTTHLHNATAFLVKKRLITRIKGKKVFELTTKGEGLALEIIEENR